MQRDESFRRGQRVDAAHPFPAVVVAVLKKFSTTMDLMRDRADPEVRVTAMARMAAKDHRGLGDAAPLGAAVAEHFADQGDRQQEDAAADQGEAVEDHVA